MYIVKMAPAIQNIDTKIRYQLPKNTLLSVAIQKYALKLPKGIPTLPKAKITFMKPLMALL